MTTFLLRGYWIGLWRVGEGRAEQHREGEEGNKQRKTKGEHIKNSKVIRRMSS